MSSVKEGQHYRTRQDWTERQRQVFGLLAKGYTNREIAEALGISLDGAKYHVSELITRLGVDSREQAADYWRERNSLRTRIRSAARAFFAPSVLRWATAGGGAVLLAGVVAAVAIVLTQGGDGQEAAAPDVTPTPVTTEPAGTATATPEAGTDDDAPDGGSGAVIDGVPVEEMEIGEAIELPEDMVVYFQMLVPESDGGPRNIWRAYRDESGTIHVEDLLEGMPTTREWVVSVAVAPERGELMVAACAGEPCSAPFVLGDTPVEVFRSTDGGMSWEEYGTLPWPAHLFGLLDEGNALFGGEPYGLYPSGEVLEPPAGIDDARPVVVNGLGLLWIDQDATHYTADGDELWAPSGAGAGISSVLPTGEHIVSWRPSEVTGPERFLGIRDPAGDMTRIFAVPGNWGISPYVPLSPSFLMSHAIYDADGTAGTGHDIVLFDLDARAVLPIPDVRPNDNPPGNNVNRAPMFEAVAIGAVLRVQTGGSCLNVRGAPSIDAEIIRCYVDSVLLFEREDDESADGWLPVRTPDGREGWASEEFLLR